MKYLVQHPQIPGHTILTSGAELDAWFERMPSATRAAITIDMKIQPLMDVADAEALIAEEERT